MDNNLNETKNNEENNTENSNVTLASLVGYNKPNKENNTINNNNINETKNNELQVNRNTINSLINNQDVYTEENNIIDNTPNNNQNETLSNENNILNNNINEQHNINIDTNMTNNETEAKQNINTVENTINNEIEAKQNINTVENTINNETEAKQNINIDTNITNNETEEDELLKAYIGKNYNKITTKRFNFAGFFLNSLYMFYRKMFTSALITSLVISILLSIVLNFIKTDNTIINSIIYIIAYLIIGANIGVFINTIYIKNAKKKINKIKTKNQEKNIDELKNICNKSGGTSIGQAILGFFTVLIIIIGIMIIISLFLFKTAFSNIIPFFNNNNYDIIDNSEYSDDEYDPDEEYNRYLELAAEEKYDGTLYFDSNVNITNEFTINAPNIFENGSNNSSYQYSYENQEVTENIFKKCSFTINVLEGYKDAEALINNMASYFKENNETTDVKNETINNINWYHFKLTNDIGKTYYYGTTKNNKVFLFEYSINEGADTNCESYLEQVINSVQSK